MAFSVNHSASRLNAYEACPRRYYHHYIVRAPRPVHRAREVGIATHAILEEATREGGWSALGETGLARLIDATWDDTLFSDGEDSRRFKALTQKRVKSSLQKAENETARILMRETRLRGQFDGISFVGVVDTVRELHDGSLVLVDYKTGSADPLGDAVRLQMAVYRFLVETTLSRPVHRVVLENLASGQSIEMTGDQHAWRTALERACGIARAIESDTSFEARLQPGCKGCDFAYRCWPYQNGGRAES